MPARLLLVAHAATAASHAVALGRPDDPCVPSGPTLPRLRRRVHSATSGPERACTTTLLALVPDGAVDPAWAGPRLGTWAGLPLPAVHERWPAELAAWLAGQDVPPPGGESLPALHARVGAALDRPWEPGLHLVVATPWTVRAAVLVALGLPPGAHRRVELGPLDAAELAAGSGGLALRRLGPPGQWAAPGGRGGDGDGE